MIPARRDGMLTEIPLVIQILMNVYMLPLMIPPRRDPGINTGLSPDRDEQFAYIYSTFCYLQTLFFNIYRYYLIERAKDAQVVGILIGTLGIGTSFSVLILL